MNDNMMDKKGIRYNSLKDAFNRLKEVLHEYTINKNKSLEKIFVDATIQRFEFTFELMWKVLKEYMENVGFSDFAQGPKGVLKFALKNGIIDDEQTYSDMLTDRNSTTHIYDEKLANQIFENIKERYVKAIEDVITYLEKEKYLS